MKELSRGVATEVDLKRVVLESTQYARQMGFEETQSRMIATAVSELGRNILKYAGGGEIRLRKVDGPPSGISIEAIDRGPGIADPEAALRDHYSSGGTLGLGLPGVKRMMDDFELESAPGTGTRVAVTKWL